MFYKTLINKYTDYKNNCTSARISYFAIIVKTREKKNDNYLHTIGGLNCKASRFVTGEKKNTIFHCDTVLIIGVFSALCVCVYKKANRLWNAD